MTTISSLAPSWLGRAKSSWPLDAIAGITLWGLTVPEAMAYAGLAGVPPQAGIYTVMIALPLYAFLGSSRQLVASATSATAATTAGVIAAVSMKPEDAIVTITIATAIVFLITAALHLDFIVRFISKPVNEGFIMGLAVFIAIGQMPKLLGVDKPDGNTFMVLWGMLGELGSLNWATVMMGFGGLALLVVMGKLAPKIPAGLVVLGGAIAISTLMDLADNYNVDTVGEVPKGLPSLQFPTLGAGDLLVVIAGAIGIMLVAMSEAISLGEQMADDHDEKFNARQDIRAFGVLNIFTGLFGGLVGAGSMSATSVNVSAGAKTPVSSIACGIMALLTVLFLTPLFTNLPEAILGALIIHAVAHHIRPRLILHLKSYAPIEMWLATLAALGVLLTEALYGLLFAMFVNLIYFIYRSSRISVRKVASLPGHEPPVLVYPRKHDTVELPSGVQAYRFDRPLFYANAQSARDELIQRIEENGPCDRLIIDFQDQTELDLTSAEAVKTSTEKLARQSIDQYFVNVHEKVQSELKRAGIDEDLVTISTTTDGLDFATASTATSSGSADSGDSDDSADSTTSGSNSP